MSTDLTFASSRSPEAIWFVVVNNRVPCADEHYAMYGGLIETGYVRDWPTRLIYRDTQCFSGWTHEAAPRRQRSWKESVMKCSNPGCNRGIGLIAYQRGWFSKGLYCSKHCRNAFVADAPNLQQNLKNAVLKRFAVAFVAFVAFVGLVVPATLTIAVLAAAPARPETSHLPGCDRDLLIRRTRYVARPGCTPARKPQPLGSKPKRWLSAEN